MDMSAKQCSNACQPRGKNDLQKSVHILEIEQLVYLIWFLPETYRNSFENIFEEEGQFHSQKKIYWNRLTIYEKLYWNAFWMNILLYSMQKFIINMVEDQGESI